MGRLAEFFEGDNRLLSMTRLVCFLSFFPASYVVLATQSGTMFEWYVSVYVLQYIGGKGCEVLKGRKDDSGN